jgi:hypothetical protein
VFAVRDYTATVPNQVLAYPALGADAPRIVYQSPHATPRLRALAPCGAQRICLVEGYDADADVVAVDFDAHASVWRMHSGDLDTLTPMGESVLGRTVGGEIGVYGATSFSVLVPSGSADVAERVDADRALLLRPETEASAKASDDTEVVGVSIVTGERIILGRVRIWPTSCSWDAQALVCATRTGFQVWRFATDEPSPDPG